MKDQLQTIRAAHDLLIGGDLLCEVKAAGLLRDALAELESMVGKQEPICWAESDGEGGILWDRDSCFSDDPAWFDSPMPLYAAPVAQQARADLEAEVKRLREALQVAVTQNEHDMLMTGEELRDARAALKGTP